MGITIGKYGKSGEGDEAGPEDSAGQGTQENPNAIASEGEVHDPAGMTDTLETNEAGVEQEDSDDVSAAVQGGVADAGTSHMPGPDEKVVVVDGDAHTVPAEAVDTVVEKAREARTDGLVADAVEEHQANAEDEAPVEEEADEADTKDGEAKSAESEEYDPSEHTVPEVNKYLSTADDDERKRVLKAEKKGKGRTGILDA